MAKTVAKDITDIDETDAATLDPQFETEMEKQNCRQPASIIRYN